MLFNFTPDDLLEIGELVGILLLPVIFMCFFKDLNILAWFSLVAEIVSITAIAIILYYIFDVSYPYPLHFHFRALSLTVPHLISLKISTSTGWCSSWRTSSSVQDTSGVTSFRRHGNVWISKHRSGMIKSNLFLQQMSVSRSLLDQVSHPKITYRIVFQILKN